LVNIRLFAVGFWSFFLVTPMLGARTAEDLAINTRALYEHAMEQYGVAMGERDPKDPATGLILRQVAELVCLLGDDVAGCLDASDEAGRSLGPYFSSLEPGKIALDTSYDASLQFLEELHRNSEGLGRDVSLASEALGHIMRIQADAGRHKLEKSFASELKRLLSGDSSIARCVKAVELAKKIFDTLEDREAVLIGAGEMAELAARHLVSNGVGRLVVVNRTLSRAEELARELGGVPLSLDNLGDELVSADIVISSTASSEVVIRRGEVEGAMKRRRYRPIFFIDIAVPRDVDPEVGRVENVYLYDIDDLKAVVEENRKRRAKESERALQIIEREVEQFNAWMREQSVIPVIVSLRRRSKTIVEQELDKTFSRLDLTPEQRRSIEKMADAIVKKILHPSFTTMKQAASQGRGEEIARVARQLFGIEEER